MVLFLKNRNYRNGEFPRNLSAPRFKVPEVPTVEAGEEEWDAYNMAYDQYMEKVKERWSWLRKTKRYRGKQVNRSTRKRCAQLT